MSVSYERLCVLGFFFFLISNVLCYKANLSVTLVHHQHSLWCLFFFFLIKTLVRQISLGIFHVINL